MNSRQTDLNLDIELTDSEKMMLLDAARTSIENVLKGKDDVKPLTGSHPKVFSEEYGLFVTLHRKGKLRGCIGHIRPDSPLFEEVQSVAYLAAFEDPRFPSLTSEELEEIDIEITLLSPMVQIKDTDLVEPGKHGLMLRKAYFQGLLLPQVATEQGWDRETFLRQTCLKAGLTTDCWKSENTEIFVFTAYIFS